MNYDLKFPKYGCMIEILRQYILMFISSNRWIQVSCNTRPQNEINYTSRSPRVYSRFKSYRFLVYADTTPRITKEVLIPAQHRTEKKNKEFCITSSLRLHLEVIFMQSTLRLFLPCPPSPSLILSFLNLTRAMPIANTTIPLAQ